RSDALTAIGTPVPTYFCPTRGGPRVKTGGPWYVLPDHIPHAQIDYAACGGLQFREGVGRLYVDRSAPPNPHAACSSLPGTSPCTVPGQEYLVPDTVTFGNLEAGASNTLMVGEKRLNRRLLQVMTLDDNEGYAPGWDQDTIRWLHLPPAPDPRD